jgi:ABC-type proline/glycine betaine transport system permease subunit
MLAFTILSQSRIFSVDPKNCTSSPVHHLVGDWIAVSNRVLRFKAFFPVVIATTAGFTSVDKGMLRLCRALTANEWQIFTSVRFPAALTADIAYHRGVIPCLAE